VNDIGFMPRADQQLLTNGLSVGVRTPHWIYRLLTLNVDEQTSWTTAGLALDRGVSSDAFAILGNNWNVDVNARAVHLGATYCDQCARGGPAVRQDPSLGGGIVVNGDSRRVLTPSLGLTSSVGDGGRSTARELDPGLTMNVSPQLQATIGASFSVNHADAQWYGNLVDSAGITHYAFARLDQRTLSFAARASYAQSPALTLEVYAAPFVSIGTYSNVRELSAMPMASAYSARFDPYVPPSGSPNGFDVRQLRSNAVVRWEYRPGSTVFLVWTHGRDGADGTDRADTQRPWTAEYRSLFALHPENTVLVKIAYWLAR
jgi:hypothetical protein